MAAAHTNRYAAMENLTRKHGIVCTPPKSISMESAVLCIGNMTGMANVHAASRMNKRDCFCGKCRSGCSCSGARFDTRLGVIFNGVPPRV